MTTPAFAVSLHDVAPATWPECERLLEMLAPYRTPVTLLVTPHYRAGVRLDAAPECIAALHARVTAGDEIALHGYFHVDDGPPPRSARDWAMRRVWTDREGEFAALDPACAGRRLDAGLAILRDVGLEPAGFVAPAWLLGRGAQCALAQRAFRYTSTRDVLLALPGWSRVSAPSFVYSTRAAWRRVLSRHWNRRRVHVLGALPRLRVALHPAEALHRRVLDEWRRLFDVLAATRSPALETAWLPHASPPSATEVTPAAAKRRDAGAAAA